MDQMSKFTKSGRVQEYQFTKVKCEEPGRVKRATVITNIKGYSQCVVRTRDMECCGISTIEKVSFIPNHDQEWMVALLYAMQYNGYSDIDDGTLKNYPDLFYTTTDGGWDNPNGSVSLTLKSLGAKVVKAFPNRVHGPSTLILCSWNPMDHLEELEEKYIYFNTPHSIIPLYMKEIWENEQEAERSGSAQPAPVAVEAKDPVDGGLVDPVGVPDVQPVHGKKWVSLKHYNQAVAQQANEPARLADPAGNPALRGV